MKIKIIDEQDKIKLTISHRELVLIYTAISEYTKQLTPELSQSLNEEVFDTDELSFYGFHKELTRMKDTINKKLNKIYPW